MSTLFTCSATVWFLTNPFLLFSSFCHGNMPTEMWCKFNIHLISLLPPMCWPQRVPRSVQLQHPHSVNKPNTTGNQLQLLPLTPRWSVVLAVLPQVGWGIVDSASFMRLCVPVPLSPSPTPRSTPLLAPCAVQFIYELRCDFSTAIWAALATASLHYASLWLLRSSLPSSLSLCAFLCVTLHLTGLQFILGCFFLAIYHAMLLLSS